jgi:hypothetical protein
LWVIKPDEMDIARQPVELGALDGTKIHANASRHSALSYEHAGKIEEQLKAEVADLMAQAEAADAAEVADGMSIPDELARREARLAKLPMVDRFSALFENGVRLLVYLVLFSLRHPTGLSGLTCAGLGVAGVRLILDGIGALFRLGEVLGGKLVAGVGVELGHNIDLPGIET